jgi:hypothetical protein
MSDGNRVLFFFPKRPNQAVTRLVSFQVFVVCVLVLIFGEDNHAVAGRVGSWCVQYRRRVVVMVPPAQR